MVETEEKTLILKKYPGVFQEKATQVIFKESVPYFPLPKLICDYSTQKTTVITWLICGFIKSKQNNRFKKYPSIVNCKFGTLSGNRQEEKIDTSRIPAEKKVVGRM